MLVVGRVITDPEAVVAQLRYPMGIRGIDRVMRGLAQIYHDPELVIITGGPLFREGWMTIAQDPARKSPSNFR